MPTLHIYTRTDTYAHSQSQTLTHLHTLTRTHTHYCIPNTVCSHACIVFAYVISIHTYDVSIRMTYEFGIATCTCGLRRVRQERAGGEGNARCTMFILLRG